MKHLNIRQERINKGWTLDYVGRQVGLKKTAIHAIETGKCKPSYDVLMKLCKLFNVPHEQVEQLFAVADDE